MSGASIDVYEVWRRFGSPGGSPVTVLRGVNLQVEASEAVAIVGPSGSGKSTLLNLLGALDQPDDGRVCVDGQDLASLRATEGDIFRNRVCGFIFQLHHLMPQLTVRENVLVPAMVGGVSASARERADRLLERVGLTPRRDYRPAQLSGGERQRVAVVRALINAPKLLLADEPTGALDRQGAESLTELLLELNREEGVTLITVTHSASLAGQMPRQITLVDGSLQEGGA